MAERTSIQTKFYTDPYIQTLPPTDKFLFKYLLDGPQIEPSLGIYELSVPTMAFHTGLDKENIEHSLARFAEARKIHYIDGWIVVINHFKNNPLRGNGPLIKGAMNRLQKVPWSIRERLQDPADVLYIPELDPKHDQFIEGGLRYTPGGPLPVPSHTLPLLPVPNPSRPTEVDKSTGWGKDRENLNRRRSM